MFDKASILANSSNLTLKSLQPVKSNTSIIKILSCKNNRLESRIFTGHLWDKYILGFEKIYTAAALLMKGLQYRMQEGKDLI